MIIYIILVAVILVLPMIKKVDKKRYCIIVGILMTAVVGFRSIHMGMGDTENIYIPLFNRLSNMSLQESLNFVINKDIEIIFYMLTRIYLIFTQNVRIYLLLLAIPLNFAVARLIYKYSKIPALSFIMFLSLNYFPLSFTLLRHCVALAILIISYDYIYNRKLGKFVITVLVAGLFHRTAWVFLIAYPLLNFRYSYKNLIGIGVFLTFSYALGEKILNWFFTIIKTGHFAYYSNAEPNTITFFCINLVIILFVMLLVPKYQKEERANLMMNLVTLGTCIASCMLFIGEAFRISNFFTIYSILLLPNAINLMKNTKDILLVEYTEVEKNNIKTKFQKLQNKLLNVINTGHNKKILIVMVYATFIIYFFAFSIHNNAIYPYVIGKLI